MTGSSMTRAASRACMAYAVEYRAAQPAPSRPRAKTEYFGRRSRNIPAPSMVTLTPRARATRPVGPIRVME